MSTTAMMGSGLIAMPTAAGSIWPIASAILHRGLWGDDAPDGDRVNPGVRDRCIARPAKQRAA
jgi:hypothetical protein